MASIKFNPFTGKFDYVGSGGGASYIDGEVEYHSSLPVTVGTPAVNSAFLVRKGEGLYFINRKPAGIWVRELNNGNLDDWKYAGTFSDIYRDANFRIINDADTSKELAFSLSGIATATTRTITVPDANVTLPNQGTSTGDSPTFAQVTINDTVNDVSTLTLANDNGPNKIEFEAQELTLRHTGTNDTPYINVTDGTDFALLGVRSGDMFLQGSNAVVRIEQSGGGLADIKVNKLVVEDATTSGDYTATFDADGNLTANRTYDLPDASGTIQLTGHAAAHASGGSDAVSPFSIGAESIFDASSSTLSGTPVTLTASRARVWTFPCFSATTVTLPTTGVEFGDRIVLRGGSPVTATITITSTGVSDTIQNTGEQFSYTYLSTGSGPRWVKNLVDNHDAARVNSGTFANARINFAAPAAIGSTTPNTLAGTQLALHDGSDTGTFVAASKLTANRTYDLPDASGTIALTSEVRFDTATVYTYTGLAAAGASESASVWFIRRSEYSSAGAYVSTTTATAVEWDDRLTASYT